MFAAMLAELIVLLWPGGCADIGLERLPSVDDEWGRW